MNFRENIKKTLIESLSKEFIAQGHNNTGKGLASIRIEFTGDEIQGYMNDYMIIQDKGVKASRIPFSGRRRKGVGVVGGKSDYIRGLMQYARSKGAASEKTAKSIAFAIAYTMRKEGMPTRGSFKFSRNGRRTDWIQESLDDFPNQLKKEVGKNINELLDGILKRTKAKLN